MVGYSEVVEVAVKRGNGKGQGCRQSLDRPVSSVKITHASPPSRGEEKKPVLSGIGGVK